MSITYRTHFIRSIICMFREICLLAKQQLSIIMNIVRLASALEERKEGKRKTKNTIEENLYFFFF